MKKYKTPADKMAREIRKSASRMLKRGPHATTARPVPTESWPLVAQPRTGSRPYDVRGTTLNRRGGKGK